MSKFLKLFICYGLLSLFSLLALAPPTQNFGAEFVAQMRQKNSEILEKAFLSSVFFTNYKRLLLLNMTPKQWLNFYFDFQRTWHAERSEILSSVEGDISLNELGRGLFVITLCVSSSHLTSSSVLLKLPLPFLNARFLSREQRFIWKNFVNSTNKTDISLGESLLEEEEELAKKKWSKKHPISCQSFEESDFTDRLALAYRELWNDRFDLTVQELQKTSSFLQKSNLGNIDYFPQYVGEFSFENSYYLRLYGRFEERMPSSFYSLVRNHLRGPLGDRINNVFPVLLRVLFIMTSQLFKEPHVIFYDVHSGNFSYPKFTTLGNFTGRIALYDLSYLTVTQLPLYSSFAPPINYSFWLFWTTILRNELKPIFFRLDDDYLKCRNLLARLNILSSTDANCNASRMSRINDALSKVIPQLLDILSTDSQVKENFDLFSTFFSLLHQLYQKSSQHNLLQQSLTKYTNILYTSVCQLSLSVKKEKLSENFPDSYDWYLDLWENYSSDFQPIEDPQEAVISWYSQYQTAKNSFCVERATCSLSSLAVISAA